MIVEYEKEISIFPFMQHGDYFFRKDFHAIFNTHKSCPLLDNVDLEIEVVDERKSMDEQGAFADFFIKGGGIFSAAVRRKYFPAGIFIELQVGFDKDLVSADENNFFAGNGVSLQSQFFQEIVREPRPDSQIPACFRVIPEFFL